MSTLLNGLLRKKETETKIDTSPKTSNKTLIKLYNTLV